MNIEDFNYREFAKQLDSARRQASNANYKCCVPGCDCNAINSHLVSKAVLKEFLCGKDNKLIQCQIDQIHPMSSLSTGELPFEKFVELGINETMSMPIFCKNHDNDLFKKYEGDANSSIPDKIEFQLLQALRAIGAHQFANSKLLYEYMLLKSTDELIQVYENTHKRYKSTFSLLYNSIVDAEYEEYTFECIKLSLMKLAICDAIVDNEELANNIYNDEFAEPLKVLYVMLIPNKEHSYLILGYHKKYVSDRLLTKMKEWVKKLSIAIDYKTIYNILCHCTNNWCISTDCDNKIIEFLKENYSEDRIDCVL